MNFTHREIESLYRDWLDDVYGDCKIAGYTYQTSRALREVDKVAYECGFANWIDSQLGDTLWETDNGYTDEKQEKEEQ